MRCLASINRSAFRAFRGRIIFVTLTYPGEWPEDTEVCKRHLKALRKRLQREYQSFAAFWRLGIQQRGAWHFHLLLFVGPSIGPVRELRRFISPSWYEVTGKVSEGHLRTGTRVEAVKKWKQVTGYAERYLAKPEEFPPRVGDRQDLGDMEPEDSTRPVGDGRGQPQGRLPDQADVQETGEEEG